jgi:general secretion pathway protein J
MKTVRPALPRRGGRGFTLVEVLVALMIMAILASLAWQGLDGILRAREGSRDSIDGTVRLTTVITQWEQDLQALYDTGLVPAISFDGQTLRVTRRTDGGVMLVAWSVRGGIWQRWTSQPMTRGGELQEMWLRSQQMLGNEAGHLTVAEGVSQWQVYFNRGGQWTNAQSTGDLVQEPIVAPLPAAPAAVASAASGAASAPLGAASAPQPGSVTLREALPDAVRLQLTLGGGTLTRDIALGASGS